MVIYVRWQQIYFQGSVFGRIVKIRCCDEQKNPPLPFCSATFIFLLLVVLTVKLLARLGLEIGWLYGISTALCDCPLHKGFLCILSHVLVCGTLRVTQVSRSMSLDLNLEVLPFWEVHF